MAIEDKYLQAPLYSLAFGATVPERMNRLISWCVVEHGRREWKSRQRTPEEIESHAVGAFKRSDPTHWEVLTGAADLGIYVNVSVTLIEHAELASFLASYKHGNDAQFRIRAEFVFEVRDGTGLSYRHFSILAALYSVIGDSYRPVLINTPFIQCRSLGYKTSEVMNAEIGNRADGVTKPLTRQMIRDDLDKLESKFFFVSANPAQKSRRRYFQHLSRMTRERLVAEIAEREFKRKAATFGRRAGAAAVESIVNERLSILSGSLLSGSSTQATTRREPLRNQRGTRPQPLKKYLSDNNVIDTNGSNTSPKIEHISSGNCLWCNQEKRTSPNPGTIREKSGPDSPICDEHFKQHYPKP